MAELSHHNDGALRVLVHMLFSTTAIHPRGERYLTANGGRVFVRGDMVEIGPQ